MRPTRPKKRGMLSDLPALAAELVVRFRIMV